MAQADFVLIDGKYYSPRHPIVLAYYAKAKTNYDAQPVGELGNTQRKRDPLPALEQSKKTHNRRKRFVAPIIEVHIISFRRKQTDLDNVIAGAKPIRDAISKSIGCDDGDTRISWTYSTITTTGATGTQILISKL